MEVRKLSETIEKTAKEIFDLRTLIVDYFHTEYFSVEQLNSLHCAMTLFNIYKEPGKEIIALTEKLYKRYLE